MDKNTVFILVEGGIVQNIWSSAPEDLQIILVDYDKGSLFDPVRTYDPYQVEQSSQEEIQGWLASWKEKEDVSQGE